MSESAPAVLPQEDFAHDIQMLDRVIVSRDGTFTDRMPGFAGRVKQNRFVDVVVFGAGGKAIWYPDSLHADDPWIHSRPHLFDDTENRAIVRLAPSEENLRTIVAEVRTIRETVDIYVAQMSGVPDTSPQEALESRFAQMEEAIVALTRQVAAKPKRGRPPKKKPEETDEPSLLGGSGGDAIQDGD